MARLIWSSLNRLNTDGHEWIMATPSNFGKVGNTNVF